ncbi:hypothetical protein [Oricola sp.]|uniref:hypothetical protein n=1 Tax=Oricola sp. TaxID=1979950 RepID=UPI0025FFBC32|nr:hypothetical protein [Oricola sp.]MCI5075262.1 hypothetical protein [Oricola sp.]
MRTRTRHSTVRFQFPFSLTGSGNVHAAGSYELMEMDEVIEGLNWVVWQRVATYLYLPLSSPGICSRVRFEIDYGQLCAALELDREQATKGVD